MAAVSYSARSALVIEASDSCLSCSHEVVTVGLFAVLLMIFFGSSLQCAGWPHERLALAWRAGPGFFVFGSRS